MMKTVMHKTGMAVAAFAAALLVLPTGPVQAAELDIDKLKSYPAGKDSDIDKVISGYQFRNSATQAMQDDDFENPGFLWVDQGEELWSTPAGESGKACQDCHKDAADSMAKAGAQYPKFKEKAGKLVNLEQQINNCRTQAQKADPWKWESAELLAMTTYVRHQSRGTPVQVDISGPAAPFFEKGKEFYFEKRGQLDMSCANCHTDNYGMMIRADRLSQGQTNGFPTYRQKWQKIGSLHRRFRGCNKNIRAQPFKTGSDEYVNLELFLAWRGQGLPIETPAVRQ